MVLDFQGIYIYKLDQPNFPVMSGERVISKPYFIDRVSAWGIKINDKEAFVVRRLLAHYHVFVHLIVPGLVTESCQKLMSTVEVGGSYYSKDASYQIAVLFLGT